MKSNKITFEMLDSYLKSKLDEKLDVRLVASFDDIPKVKTQSDADNYIIMSDDIITTDTGETINRKGYIYSAHKTGDSYTFTGIQEKIEFYPYDLLNDNPFALKNHTHKPTENDGIQWKDIQNTPDEYMPEKHLHDWDDFYNKPETFPPSEHSHNDTIPSATWDSILDKPNTFTPSEHTHEFSEISNYPYNGIVNKFYNPAFRIYQRVTKDVPEIHSKKNIPFKYSATDGKKMYFDRWLFYLYTYHLSYITFDTMDVGFRLTPTYNNYQLPKNDDEESGYFLMQQKLHIKDLGYTSQQKNQTIPLTITLGSNVGNEECIFETVRVLQNDKIIGYIDKDNNIIHTDYTVTDENQLEYLTFTFHFIYTGKILKDPDRSTRFLEVYYTKLEIGETATPFVLDSYENELNGCRKFYQIIKTPHRFILTNYRRYFDIPITPYRKMNFTPTVTLGSDLCLFNINDETESVLLGYMYDKMKSDLHITNDVDGLFSIGNFGQTVNLPVNARQMYFLSGSSVKEAMTGVKPMFMLEAEYE